MRWKEQPQQPTRRQRSNKLADHVGWRLLNLQTSGDRKPNRHGWIEVRAGHVSHRVNHCQNDEPERQRNADVSNRSAGHAVDNDCPGSRKNEAKGSDEFGKIRFHEISNKLASTLRARL